MKLKRYYGPPGDKHEYWLPRDVYALDVAWDYYYREHGEPDSNTHIHVWLCRDCGMEREPLYGPDF